MSKPIKSFNPTEFWKNLKRGDSGCWECSNSHTAAGYSQTWIYPKMQYSHRLAWSLAVGTIPDDLHVLHHCDNPSCCNPDHLFLGTPKDNAQDMVNKGRSRNGNIKGIDHTLSKLTEQDIIDIRKNYRVGTPNVSSPYSIRGLAKFYNVARSLIHRIIKNQSWSHI